MADPTLPEGPCQNALENPIRPCRWTGRRPLKDTHTHMPVQSRRTPNPQSP